MIKHIVKYKLFPGVAPIYDIVYHSGRVVCRAEKELPQTAKDFLKRSTYSEIRQYGHLDSTAEFIYA